MRFLAMLIILLAPVPSLGIGQVYAGFSGAFMELTSVEAEVWIEDHIAVTRVEQVFTSHADWQEEAVYEFVLPPGAIITDMWLWIEDEPVQALIMEKEEARRIYEEVVRRRIDPALVEHVDDNRFVMNIFPFPERGSRRIALEYAQILHSQDGQINYTFPLVPDESLRDRFRNGWITTKPVATMDAIVDHISLFTLNVNVKSQHPMTVTVSSGESQNSSVDQPDPHKATIFFGEEEFSLEQDLHIRMERTDDSLMPTLLSYGPGYNEAASTDHIGYYLLWLPGYLYTFEVPAEREDSEFVLKGFGLTTVEEPQEAFKTLDDHVMHIYRQYGVSQAGRYETGGPVAVWTLGQLADEEVSGSYAARLAMDTSNESHAIQYVPRLWAYHKVRTLEKLGEDAGWPDELVQEIIDLGIEYRLVTSRTSLFAPDETVEVDPEVAERGGWGFTTNVEGTATTHWLGHEFLLKEGLWVDVDYRPDMPREIYEGRILQPALLADFVELGEEMVVVVDDRAYEIQPGRPILHQNAPNPFNSSTLISFVLPADASGDHARLGIYNLQGQLVRNLNAAIHGVGRETVTWDGLDQEGRPAASGVYVYRLEAGEWAVKRRMLLLR